MESRSCSHFEWRHSAEVPLRWKGVPFTAYFPFENFIVARFISRSASRSFRSSRLSNVCLPTGSNWKAHEPGSAVTVTAAAACRTRDLLEAPRSPVLPLLAAKGLAVSGRSDPGGLVEDPHRVLQQPLLAVVVLHRDSRPSQRPFGHGGVSNVELQRIRDRGGP